MSDELKPALSAAEWRSVRSKAFGAGVYRGDVSGRLNGAFACLTGNGDDDADVYVGADEAPTVIALANAALPDDSPYKITRAPPSRIAP